MKRVKKIKYCFILIVLLSFVTSFAQSSIKKVYCYSDSLYFLLLDNGSILRKTHMQDNWKSVEVDQSLELSTIFFLNNSIGWIGTTSGELFLSQNGGQSWQLISDLNTSIRKIYFSDNQIGYILADSLFESDIIYKTVSGGESWNQLYQNSYITDFLIHNNDNLIVSHGITDSDWYIIKSTNNGSDWETIYTSYGVSIDYLVYHNNRIYGVGQSGHMSPNGLFISSDSNGSTWEEKIISGLPLKGLELSDSRLITYSTSFDFVYATYFFECSPVGVVFPNIGSIHNKTILSLSYANAEIGYAISNNDLLYTTDSSKTWSNEIITSITDDEIKLVNGYKLDQNYPNPFNPVTTISFTILNESIVRLTVYNVLGQKVKSLLNELMLPGKHSVEFDANNLSTSIYFYRIESGDHAQTKKMILLK